MLNKILWRAANIIFEYVAQERPKTSADLETVQKTADKLRNRFENNNGEEIASEFLKVAADAESPENLRADAAEVAKEIDDAARLYKKLTHHAPNGKRGTI